MQIKPVAYRLTVDWLENEYCPRQLTYGIAAQSSGCRMVIRDISTCRARVESLALCLNRAGVSLHHFREVIEDSLGV